MRAIRLITSSYNQRPTLDTAISRVLLEHVSNGLEPETLRIYCPPDVVAFGPQDQRSPGYSSAISAAMKYGFTPIERLAGGRAAVFHSETIAFSWTIPSHISPRGEVNEIFEEIAAIVAAALKKLGIDARIGEVAGEYCPGEHSVNARGMKKIMGVGQRIIKNGTHVGGVLVVDGAHKINEVLIPVYDALQIPWDERATGSVKEEVQTATYDQVHESLVNEFASRYDLYKGYISQKLLNTAYRLEPEHRAMLS